MILNTPISTIMTEDVIIVGAADDSRDVAITFNNHGIRHAPVTSRGKLVGMLSWIDLKRMPVVDPDGMIKSTGKVVVGELMTHDPVSIQADDTVGELAEILTENDFHAVPVMEGERIVGIVSTTDVIRFFLERLS